MLQKYVFIVLLFLTGWLTTACEVVDRVSDAVASPAGGTTTTVIPAGQTEPASSSDSQPTPLPDVPPAQDVVQVEESPTAVKSGEFAHNGISLTYDPVLWGEVTVQDIAATADQGLFGQPTPAFTWMGFAPREMQGEAANHWTIPQEPQIIVFNRHGFGSFALADTIARERIGAFEGLLVERPSSFAGEVPILPLVNAAQTIQAQVRWLDFSGGSGLMISGVRFITAYAQDVAPLANDRLIYIFYGLTADGQYGVTVTFPLAAATLPETAPVLSDEAITALNENYDEEMMAVTEQLNGLGSSDFDPQLSQLDALVQSLTIAPTAVDQRVTPVGPQNALLKTDSDIVSSPGGGASLDTLSAGDAVVVNGSSSDSLYRRILCADGTTGSCWLPGDVVQIVDTGSVIPGTPGPMVDGQVVQIQALVENVVFAAPGEDAAFLGTLRVGETAEVLGMDAGGNWLKIVCPRYIGVNCWVTIDTEVNKPTGFFSTGTVTASPVPSPTATATVIPATKTVTPSPVPPATITPAGCTNSAALIADVTVPDSTQFAPSTGFNKTWRIKNTGTCTWDGRYRLIHHAGSLLGAITSSLPFPGSTAPGQSIDITLSLVSPAAPGSYQSDWLLQTPQGHPFGVGRSGSPFWVKIVVPDESMTTISGVVYQDANQDGIYNSGEVLMGGREVRLFAGPACQVIQQAIAATFSDGNGRYAFEGAYEGSYCVGLAGSNGLDDVTNVAIAAGQTMNDINLRSPIPAGSISGFLWADYCLTDENGQAVDGDCVADGNGGYRADGMIEPDEGYIAGVTVLLQAGRCATDNAVAVSAVTDGSGRYVFDGLPPGTYCVSMNAASPENAPRLLPGDWTFPANSIWYQEITLLGFDNAYPVNFGWDYQLQ